MLNDSLASDPLARFGHELSQLSPRNIRRIGLLLMQVGVLLTAATFCVSIAAMNAGLITALVGALLARAPLHRAIGGYTLLVLLFLLAVSTVSNQEWKELAATSIIPVGLLVAQGALHVSVPGAARLRRAIAIAMIAAIILGTILALSQYFIGRGKNRPFRINPAGEVMSRSSGFFGLHLTQGGVMGLLVFLVAGVTVGMEGWWRRIAVASSVLSVLICGARAATMGLVAATTAAIAAGGRRAFFIAGITGLLLLGVGLAILRLTQPERFHNLVNLQDGRWPIWRASIQVSLDHPLLGTGGSAGFRPAYREVYPVVVPNIPSEFPNGAPHAHNTQLAHAAEHGIPFALCWLVLLLVPLLHLGRRRESHPELFRLAVGCGIMVLVFGQFEKLDGETSRTLWTGLGILLALSSHPGRLVGIVSDEKNITGSPIGATGDR